MNVKIDTKEKFTVITPQFTNLTANMTEQLSDMLLPYIQKGIPHIILKLATILELDEQAANWLTTIQQRFYEHNCSFVICELQPTVAKQLDQLEILETMNVTPTESEAWDILQMEEIERELLGGTE